MSQSSPLQRPFYRSGHGLERSSCSIRSAGSSGTVRHHRLRSLSGSSLSSLTSLWVPPFRRQSEYNLTESESAFNRRMTLSSDQRTASRNYSQRASFTSLLSSVATSEPRPMSSRNEQRPLLDVAECDGEMVEPEEDAQSLEDEDFFDTDEQRENPTTITLEHDEEEDAGDLDEQQDESAGMRRWLSVLCRRGKHTVKETPFKLRKHRLDHTELQHNTPSPLAKRQSAHHKPSDSQSSSLLFVTAVKSATATIASLSIATVSRRTTQWRRGHQRSSLVSGSDPRRSVESQRSVDEAAKLRSRRRRAKLEELIRSEEGYLADIKALSKAYITILSTQPSTALCARNQVLKNFADITTLHDDLLSSFHDAVPFADHDMRTAATGPGTAMRFMHTRWHSMDAVPMRSPPTNRKLATIRQGRRSLNISRSSSGEGRMMHCSPQTVARVAKTFIQYIEQFAVYEEYGANYELVQRHVEELQRDIAAWPEYDRAIELLAAHVNPVNSREANRRKALTIKDLLIKPIQRLPRYELVFSDLCKLTPVCDDPEANAALRDLLQQLNESCQLMNAAKDNPTRARMLATTCMLGDRLTFSNQVPRTVFLQLLGQVQLCGCLFVAYRNKERIKGMYTICVLFESTLLLAVAEDDNLRYSTIAGISLANATIVECDNGKGLQCYTAPYAWKLVFEHSARMFEIIVVACSAAEATIWRQHITERSEAQAKAVAEGTSNVFELHSPLTAELRSVGKAFGKPGSFIRRMSVHRTATVGPTTDLNQVIIKNTQSSKEAIDNSSSTSLQIPRSQSVATPSHVQTLAPRRADRIRLEGLLTDVWTKDLVPYPGMTPRRSDPIRASANHVIRKFSMASITSNFSSSKRTASYTSIAGSRKEDVPPLRGKSTCREPRSTGSRQGGPPLVDFHNAPEAFLPADFELKDPATKKKSAFRTFTMTMERPFSPLLGNENKQSGLRRAQSVRDLSGSVPRVVAPSTNTYVEKAELPVYSVIQERPKTPVPKMSVLQPKPEPSSGVKEEEAVVKTPRKSKSRLMRFFG